LSTLERFEPVKRFDPIVNVLLVPWALLVGIVLTVPQIPNPLNLYLALVISVVFAALALWAYITTRKKKHVSMSKAEVTRRTNLLLLSDKIMSIFSCGLIIFSAYVFYKIGYVAGLYQMFLDVLSIPILNATVTAAIRTKIQSLDVMSTVNTGLLVSSIGMISGIFAIGRSLYFHGLIHGIRIQQRRMRQRKRKSS